MTIFLLWILNNPIVVICKVKRAMQRGATAIIFDITDHPEAATEVTTYKLLFLLRTFMIIYRCEC